MAPRFAILRRWIPAIALAILVPNVQAATITIINTDSPGQGLNDPTAAVPVGGNPGTTVGQQRINVFETAASIWGGILSSAVVIQVEASFQPLPCSSLSGVLGSAGPNYIFWDYPNAPLANTSYTKAQADKHAGVDLYPGFADIGTAFNSSIGQSGCLDGRSWYYGYDHAEGNPQFDFLAVVLHEIGHGLGFLTFVNDDTGELAYGIPDIYSRFILDAKTGLHWSDETDVQRAASDTATFRVLWDGSAVRFKSPTILGPRPLLRINSPGAIAADYPVGIATFGAPLTAGGVTGAVALGLDGSAPTGDACEPLTNPGQVAGKIALVDRGLCGFTTKVKNCQDAGAIAVLVANDADLSEPVGMSGVDPTITIPSVRITKAEGDAIKAQLGGGVNVTLLVDPTQLAGADPQGRVMLYAPRPNQPGSSISHWDVTCSPNLLMEPNINADLTSSIDLARYAMQDMGWFLGDVGVPQGPAALARLGLETNAPNPFEHATAIAFDLPVAGDVELSVYDPAGRRVRTLVSGPMPAGSHRTVWDGTDDRGEAVHGGVYFSRLSLAGATRSRGMLMVR
jgi:hypothetical protein